MSQTVIRGTQILNNTVQRQDLDTSTVGQAVVTKLVQGSGITLSSTGADSGTGDVTVTSPDVVSTDAGNIATLGTDNHILVPQSQIWSATRRVFQAIGNPTFEVDQRSTGAAVTNPTNFVQDRWLVYKAGTMTCTAQQVDAGKTVGTGVALPGTSFVISNALHRITLTGQEASLGVGHQIVLYQNLEGPQLRELIGDVHSISILARSTVANLKFGCTIKDPGANKSLSKLCTLGATPLTWQLIQLPNLPVFPVGGNFSSAPGVAGYLLLIQLAADSSLIAPANDTWQNGNFSGAVGQSNFAASPINSYIDFAFVQHEPGPQCTTPIDCPFTQNYDDCLRYFQKSYAYASAIGTVTALGELDGVAAAAVPQWVVPSDGRFSKPMAKVPAIGMYDPNNGAANSMFNNSRATHATVSGFSGTSEKYIGAINVSTAQQAGDWLSVHYSADTAW